MQMLNNTDVNGSADDDNDNFIYAFNIIWEVLIAFASVAGNSVVLLLIIRDKQLHTVTNYFVASLAAADLLVGALGIPCVLVVWHGFPHNFTGCLIVNSMIVVLTQISIFGLLIIAVERFFAIKEPFKYKNFCTETVAGVCIGITWCSGTVIGLVPVFGWNLGPMSTEECSFTDVIDLNYMVYFNFLGFVLVPLILIFIIYGYIYRVVMKQKRQIASMQISVSPTNMVKSQTFKRETKAAKWFAVVIFIFTLCWLPIHIMNFITLSFSKSCFSCLVLAIILSHANSAINPVLYAYGNTKFRLAFLRLLGETPTISTDIRNVIAEVTTPSITIDPTTVPAGSPPPFSKRIPSYQSKLATVPE